jgi:predicted N-acetyltransferase YhbS
MSKPGEVRIRSMRAGDLQPAVAAIRHAGWGERQPELSFYLRHQPTTVFVAEQDGGIVGTAIVTLNAGIGWLGLVFVAPALRGQGLGSRLTRTGLEYLQERSTRSILLAASELGRPIYEKLGFVVDGHYSVIFGPGRGGTAASSEHGVRSMEPPDVPAASALDRAATGEDRAHLLEALAHGWVVEGDGRVRGYALRTPWGYGPAIADDEASGTLLLDQLRAQAPEGQEMRLMVPRDNLAAIQHLADAGFEVRGGLPRMRLGEPVPWQPSRIWATVNAALG